MSKVSAATSLIFQSLNIRHIWAVHNGKIEHFLTSFFVSIWGYYIVQSVAVLRGVTILTLANVLLVGTVVAVSYALYDKYLMRGHLPGYEYMAGVFGVMGAEILWLKIAVVAQ
jgi:hypothetical protein